MGMSTNVQGFIEKDAIFIKMKKVYDTCLEAGVNPPKEVMEYFDDFSPNDPGIEIKLPESCIKKYFDDSAEGFEILIDKLPKKVKVIRFYNSW